MRAEPVDRRGCVLGEPFRRVGTEPHARVVARGLMRVQDDDGLDACGPATFHDLGVLEHAPQ